MGLLSKLGNMIHSLFDKIGAFIARLWQAAEPFLKEVLSKTAQNVWASSQDLFIAAAQYVAQQGLPSTEEKQKAFRDYMTSHASEEVKELKDSELNLLREMAVAIIKKVKEQE